MVHRLNKLKTQGAKLNTKPRKQRKQDKHKGPNSTNKHKILKYTDPDILTHTEHVHVSFSSAKNEVHRKHYLGSF